MLLTFTCFYKFTLHQTDVNSTFFNAYIKEEAYVKQPLRFEGSQQVNHVYKFNKVLYGLKQAPRTWYET